MYYNKIGLKFQKRALKKEINTFVYLQKIDL